MDEENDPECVRCRRLKVILCELVIEYAHTQADLIKADVQIIELSTLIKSMSMSSGETH